jgi:hypothetical protein
LPLSLCVVSMLLSPTLSYAASETGSVAANQAADQKAALAKKAADRQKAAEEKQKAAEEEKAKTEEK